MYTKFIAMKGRTMQIEIQIDETYHEPKILILTNRITDEINEVFK